MEKEYPCEKCTRVECPRECNLKKCRAWQEWFLYRWSLFNNFAKKYGGGR